MVKTYAKTILFLSSLLCFTQFILVYKAFYLKNPRKNKELELKNEEFEIVLDDIIFPKKYSYYNTKRTWDISNVSKLKDKNPFKKCKLNLTNVSHLNIPQWHFSSSQKKYVFGGFTADLGWILTVARYSVLNNNYMLFPATWGHGGYQPTDMFEQISLFKCIPNHLYYREIDAKYNKTLRHELKLFDFYDRGKRRVYPEYLHPENDLQSMRIIFFWIFKLNKISREYVEKYKRENLENYSGKKYVIGIHVRQGDKIGRGGGPKESREIPLRHFYGTIKGLLDSRNLTKNEYIFVASDDYAVVKYFRQKGLKVDTLVDPSNTGFRLHDYKPNLTKTLEFWAELEILAQANTFVTDMHSNVAKTVHLMRLGKDPDTTIDVGLTAHNKKSCCQTGDWKRNCFWLCS